VASLALALSAALLGSPALEAELSARVFDFVRPRFGPPAVAVGYLVDGVPGFVGMGEPRDDADGPPTPHTLYEIGSITKVFTTALLCLSPEVDLKRPRLGGPPLTLEQLATHTSGLARLHHGFFGATVSDRVRIGRDPYRHQPRSTLFEWAATAPREAPPGTAVRYSNAGMALAGELAAEALGAPYGVLLRDRVLRPLGLMETWLVVPSDHQPLLADGRGSFGGMASHWTFGPTRGDWDVGAYAPAGALRSSVADLLRFMAAQQTDPRLRACHQTRARFPKARGGWRDVGLGWFRRPMSRTDDRVVVWHNGGTGGFNTFLGFIEGTRTGVVVLANVDSSEVDLLAIDLLEILGGPSATP
jgi:serine-type D-Ala-D-Ala carboxypeptidase/endopeptidase